ncbi:MAG: ATP-dependent Clp protease ATP-binding subunit ClpA, partial [Alphaproteobacteria bacterium]
MSQFEAGNSLNRTEMSQNLRGSLQRAISYADEQSHRQVTLEHLLLALADDREAGVILQASAVNVPALMTEV